MTLCSILIAIGLGAGCVDPTPPRDRAAEVLVEQEQARQDEFAEAMEKRRRLYEGIGTCRNCGTINTDPFPQER